MTVILGVGRDKQLGLTKDQLGKRLKANRKIEKDIIELTQYMTEGHMTAYGLQFPNGIALAEMLSNCVAFTIAALQEKGKLAKKLPGTTNSRKVEETKGHGTYL